MAYFARYFGAIPERSELRKTITRQTRAAEADCIAVLLPCAEIVRDESVIADPMAHKLAVALRERSKPGIVEKLVQEFSLSSEEGIALMSLAEALLRTPDAVTRDMLIRDQICLKDWLSHTGRTQGVVLNTASFGLAATSKMLDRSGHKGAVRNLLQRYGEPVVRRAVQYVMKMMGSQFVLGETISRALKRSRKRQERGFTYSYDMLGEAALDYADAARYQASYHAALEAIGQQAKKDDITGQKTIYEKPGLSIKLSALHPRYQYSQRARVLAELLPVVKALALRARHYNIGLTIDAEESERLELSLDILEALCSDPDLAGWDGIGFVVQAYGKRAYLVLDYLIDLARITQHRLMIRLVKGAYWDSEIKKAQSEGMEDFPVFTRKCHTDISYLACARKLIEASDVIFPQFATHNARSVATIYAMAEEHYKKGFQLGQYEFQCLHGMGESLYDEIVGPAKYNRPCRIYAPVGTYETLLAYLVRRLLENGANSSFVNLLGNADIPIDRLIEDPVKQAREIAEKEGCAIGAPHPAIAQPSHLFGAERRNSRGMDLQDESVLSALERALDASVEPVRAAPVPQDGKGQGAAGSVAHKVCNPADPDDIVGQVVYATPQIVNAAVGQAEEGFKAWSARTSHERADILDKAADLLEERRIAFMALAVREAGKTYPNAVAEIREAIDFLRYYSAEIRGSFHNETHHPLGPVVCISPWNFPLAIFIGQIAAALAAGNTVLAKPAEETPLIAFRAVTLLYEAGVPEAALHYVPGAGDIGAALVADRRIAGVMFTGSTSVAQSIAYQLVGRVGRNGQPVPLVAETGGQNAMIVDSTALAEQVVADVLASAFDSAGQRCSALRLLCVQDEAAPRLLPLLRGAMAELAMGNPAARKTDIGPVISPAAKQGIEAHIARFRDKNHKIFQPTGEGQDGKGHFVAPTLIEIHALDDLQTEVFGPVLHVLCYQRLGLHGLMNDINASGYGLTFGVHSRLASTIHALIDQTQAGNIYINCNMVGAVVGMQPFGGRGLSGTGPKAGGPFTIRRQLSSASPSPLCVPGNLPGMARSWLLWLGVDDRALAQEVTPWMEHGLLYKEIDLPAPVGEQNRYSLHPRGRVLALAQTDQGLKRIISYALSCGNEVHVLCTPDVWEGLYTMPDILREVIRPVQGKADIAACSVILADEMNETLWQVMRDLLIDPMQPVPLAYHAGPDSLMPEMLLEERTISTNTAAVGGNAKLMALI